MPLKRIILEMGAGNDLHGGDYTKAALRAVQDALLAVLPHGTGTVELAEGGLEIFNDAGTGSTVLAHAAAIVRLDVA